MGSSDLCRAWVKGSVGRRRSLFSRFFCGGLFSGDLVLTHVASQVPGGGRLTAVAKRFRRHLSGNRIPLRRILFNYLSLAGRRIDRDSLFLVDLTDLAKPRAKKLEYLATVRDGDTGVLVPGYWCVEVYALDQRGVLWPMVLWPYSLAAQIETSQTLEVLHVLNVLDDYFGPGFGIYVFDRGFDGSPFIEALVASGRHFIIRQRGDRTVVLPNAVRIIESDLVEHLLSRPGTNRVYQKVSLPNVDHPLYLVAYHNKGHDDPVILLTDLRVTNDDLALQMQNRYASRWDCEPAAGFFKGVLGGETFAVRTYRSIQQLIFLAGLVMGFLSYLQSSLKHIDPWLTDPLRYCRTPKRLWAHRLITALRDAVGTFAAKPLTTWCHPP